MLYVCGGGVLANIQDLIVIRKIITYVTSQKTFCICRSKLNKSKYRISIRGPTLWKNIPTDTEKKQQKTNIFKTILKNKLFVLENEHVSKYK